jgi:hypothetical protein
VWGEVRSLLEDPQRLDEEYRRRLTRSSRALGTYDAAQVDTQVSKLRRGVAGMIDSYAAGLIEKDEFEPRIKLSKERVAKLEEHMRQLADEASLKAQLELIVGKSHDFAAKVKEGLDKPDWSTRRELIRALVRRIEVGEEQVNVIFRVDPGSLAQGTDGSFLQHCWRRHHASWPHQPQRASGGATRVVTVCPYCGADEESFRRAAQGILPAGDEETGKKIAVVAVARKLLTIACGVLKRRVAYDPAKLLATETDESLKTYRLLTAQ